MKRVNESDLMRLVCGQLDPAEARAVERAVADDPELMARLHALRSTWDGLEEPEFVPPGAEFVRALRERLAAEPPAWDPWRASGTLGRLATAAALAAGIALGVGLGRTAEPDAPDPLLATPTLADAYLAVLESPESWDEMERREP